MKFQMFTKFNLFNVAKTAESGTFKTTNSGRLCDFSDEKSQGLKTEPVSLKMITNMTLFAFEV